MGRLFGPLRRDKMNDPVAVALEVLQECREHFGCLRLGVVQQDDAFAFLVETFGQQLQLLLRCHGIPVARPQVGSEHGDPARLQTGQQRGCRGKAGKAEKGRGRNAAARAIQRHFIGGDTAVDFLQRLRLTDLVEGAMGPCVVADAMAARGDLLDDGRICFGIPADQEKRRLHAFGGKGSQNFRCGGGKGAVIEGQHNLLVRQRQGLREALEADAGKRLRVHGHHAESPERVLARTLGEGGGRRHGGECHKPGLQHDHDELPVTVMPAHI